MEGILGWQAYLLTYVGSSVLPYTISLGNRICVEWFSRSVFSLTMKTFQRSEREAEGLSAVTDSLT